MNTLMIEEYYDYNNHLCCLIKDKGTLSVYITIKLIEYDKHMIICKQFCKIYEDKKEAVSIFSSYLDHSDYMWIASSNISIFKTSLGKKIHLSVKCNTDKSSMITSNINIQTFLIMSSTNAFCKKCTNTNLFFIKL